MPDADPHLQRLNSFEDIALGIRIITANKEACGRVVRVGQNRFTVRWTLARHDIKNIHEEFEWSEKTPDLFLTSLAIYVLSDLRDRMRVTFADGPEGTIILDNLNNTQSFCIQWQGKRDLFRYSESQLHPDDEDDLGLIEVV